MGCVSSTEIKKKFFCNFCNFKLNYDYDNILHCCHCNIIINSDEFNHCFQCHQTYSILMSHCCQCKESYDFLDFHCCQCKKTIKNGEHKLHCNDCHVIYSRDDIHCCQCKITIDKTKLHCSTCHITYPTYKIHCCVCQCISDNHCNNCHISFSQNDKHCCICKNIYNKNQYHCDKCHIIIDNYDEQKYSHCCVCKDIFPKEQTFICKCVGIKNEYIQNCKKCGILNVKSKTILNHCCKCKQLYSQYLSHCDLCCKTYYKNTTHNCKSHNYENNIISIIDNILNNDLYDSLLKNNINVLSECIYYRCNSTMKFLKGLEYLGININDFSRDSKYWTMVFHGTPTPTYADSICCNGMILDKRGTNGQVHGPGEYFSTNIDTAKYYAKNTGGILYCIIIKPEYSKGRITTHKRSNTEIWYIMNNTEDYHFYLPIYILKHFVDITHCQHCFTRKNNDIIKEIKNGNIIKNIHYIDDNFQTIKYNDEEINFVCNNIRNNILVFNMKINNYDYNIDINKMTQKNLITNKIRTILFE
jgi:hypothetical protein